MGPDKLKGLIKINEDKNKAGNHRFKLRLNDMVQIDDDLKKGVVPKYA